jgi:hypothetical protein
VITLVAYIICTIFYGYCWIMVFCNLKNEHHDKINQIDWFFHPEYIHPPGLKYRKMMIITAPIFGILLFTLWVLGL